MLSTTIYPLSADPIHSGHLNILNKAQISFGTNVHLLLCKNPLKTDGLLTMQERKHDAVITILSRNIQSGNISKRSQVSDFVKKIQSHVSIAESKTQIYQALDSANNIVRGVRSTEDHEYSMKLIDHFNSPDWTAKGTLIVQDPDFIDVSSTGYKRAYGSICSEFISLPKTYHFLNKEIIDASCQNGTEKPNPVLVTNIREYFELVNELEKTGWFN